MPDQPPPDTGCGSQPLTDKRLSRRHFLGAAGGLATALPLAGLLGACSQASASQTLKVGVLAPFSNQDSTIGTVVSHSLQAAVRRINTTHGGLGRKVELIFRDTGTGPQAGARLYGQLIGVPDLVAVLWCGDNGLDQALPRIKADGRPVMVVFEDLYSSGQLYPDSSTPGRSVFQLSPPDTYAKGALAAYAHADRGYTSAGLLYDRVLDPTGMGRTQFERTFGGAGMTLAAAESFATGDTDLSAQLGRLQAAAPKVVFVDGYPADVATAVEALAVMGASYLDQPTAQGPGWHPQVFGSFTAMGDGTWAATAGDAAKTGSVTATHLGGLPYLPTFTIRDWMKRYLGAEPTGSEDLPADALFSVLQGINKAGTTDRRHLVGAIEALKGISFASLPFGFASGHLAHTPDEMVIMSLEHLEGPVPTDPAYRVGREWQTGQFYGASAAAPTQLLRPTLAANRRAQPRAVSQILSQGWGTQCTKEPDGTLSPVCKVH